MTDCPPGDNPHADRPNFTLEDYFQMCRDGEAAFSVTEVCRLMGWTRQYYYRVMELADAPDDVFEGALATARAKGRLTTTGVTDEIRRHTGNARTYVEHCPHCGGSLRERFR